jgi:hypothetical protein
MTLRAAACMVDMDIEWKKVLFTVKIYDITYRKLGFGATNHVPEDLGQTCCLFRTR